MPNPKGTRGEAAAAAYLVSQNYKILKRNFRTSLGEVDIIGEEDQDVVFVEVKTWDEFDVKDLEFSITPAKIRKLVRLAEQFLAQNHELQDRIVRFDVLFLSQAANSVQHWKNAFTESGFL